MLMPRNCRAVLLAGMVVLIGGCGGGPAGYRALLADQYRYLRQGVSPAADGVVRGTTYAFNQPALFVNAWDKMSALEANPDADCDMKYTRSGGGWRGTVDPNVCRFWSSRRNAERGLGAVSEIDSAGLRQTEWAFDETGKLAFGSGPDKLITMVRQ